MDNKLVFKDGTEVINGFASKTSSNEKLMLRIPGNDLVNATLLASNPEKTGEITCYYGVTKTVYSGFTSLFSIQFFADENYVEVWLKGENTSTHQEYTVSEMYLPEQWRTHNEEAES